MDSQGGIIVGTVGVVYKKGLYNRKSMYSVMLPSNLYLAVVSLHLQITHLQGVSWQLMQVAGD